jgi:membrane peptidoglycan carboxypeptidase
LNTGVPAGTTLKQVPVGNFSNDWDAAAKTGTWQYGTSTSQNSHAWTVGYTRALAAAVWVGTKDGGPLLTKSGGTDVFGSSFAGPIWRQFMAAATTAMNLDKSKARFVAPKVTPSPTPSPTPEAPPSPTPTPTPKPTPTPSLVPSLSPKPTKPPTGPPVTGLPALP